MGEGVRERVIEGEKYGWGEEIREKWGMKKKGG